MQVCSSPNINRVSKSRGTEWAKNTVCVGEIRNANNTLDGNLNGRDYF
jgi:hypothetical protein